MKLTKEEIIVSMHLTLAGLEMLKTHYKHFEMLIGSYAKEQYEGLLNAEHLAKQYIIELSEEEGNK